MRTCMQLPHKVFLEEVEEADKVCSGYIPVNGFMAYRPMRF